MTDTYKVSGMTCDGCVKAVTSAITTALPNVEVQVDLESGKVTIIGAADKDVVAVAVNDAGFTFDGTVN